MDSDSRQIVTYSLLDANLNGLDGHSILQAYLQYSQQYRFQQDLLVSIVCFCPPWNHHEDSHSIQGLPDQLVGITK
jgi:hypothetical protein